MKKDVPQGTSFFVLMVVGGRDEQAGRKAPGRSFSEAGSRALMSGAN
jgi:hypothetical protein